MKVCKAIKYNEILDSFYKTQGIRLLLNKQELTVLQKAAIILKKASSIVGDKDEEVVCEIIDYANSLENFLNLHGDDGIRIDSFGGK